MLWHVGVLTALGEGAARGAGGASTALRLADAEGCVAACACGTPDSAADSAIVMSSREEGCKENRNERCETEAHGRQERQDKDGMAVNARAFRCA